jgi:hypothetical protein
MTAGTVAVMRGSGASALPLTPDGLRADLAARIGSVDGRARDSTLQVWRAFLAHLALPLDGDESHRCDMENVAFWVRSRDPDSTGTRSVMLERRTGVQEEGWGYAGTLVSEVAVVVSAGSAWNEVGEADEYEMERNAPINETDGYDSFVREVEGSRAFSALASSELVNATVSVYWA